MSQVNIGQGRASSLMSIIEFQTQFDQAVQKWVGELENSVDNTFRRILQKAPGNLLKATYGGASDDKVIRDKDFADAVKKLFEVSNEGFKATIKGPHKEGYPVSKFKRNYYTIEVTVDHQAVID